MFRVGKKSLFKQFFYKATCFNTTKDSTEIAIHGSVLLFCLSWQKNNNKETIINYCLTFAKQSKNPNDCNICWIQRSKCRFGQVDAMRFSSWGEVTGHTFTRSYENSSRNLKRYLSTFEETPLLLCSLGIHLDVYTALGNKEERAIEKKVPLSLHSRLRRLHLYWRSVRNIKSESYHITETVTPLLCYCICFTRMHFPFVPVFRTAWRHGTSTTNCTMAYIRTNTRNIKKSKASSHR